MATKLENALSMMNALMADTPDGLTVEEFPEACSKASAKFGVKYEDLADAYDEQFGEGNLAEKWDAIPDAEKAELTKAFAQGFSEQVSA